MDVLLPLLLFIVAVKETSCGRKSFLRNATEIQRAHKPRPKADEKSSDTSALEKSSAELFKNDPTSEEKVSEVRRLARLRECCDGHKVLQWCTDICDYKPDFKQMICMADSCYNDYQRWMYCASDGIDNTECCKKKGIPQICNVFCEGNFPSINELLGSWAYLPCLASMPKILQCHESNLQKQPRWEAERETKDFDNSVPNSTADAALSLANKFGNCGF